MRKTAYLASSTTFILSALFTAASCGTSFESTGPASSASSTSESATTTSTSSSGAGGDTSSSSSAGSGGGAADDCLSGKIPCSDPRCDPFVECVAPAPGGWTGPVQVASSKKGSLPNDCGAGWATKKGMYDNLKAPDPACKCSCDDATGVTCGSPPFFYEYTSANCMSGGGMPYFIPGDGTCVVDSSTITASSGRADAPAASTNGASCGKQQDMTTPPVVWGESLLVCADATAQGCMDKNQACVPKHDPNVTELYCIFKAGQDMCPPEYPNMATPAASYADNRKCINDCSCGSVMNATCKATISLFTGADCSGVATTTIAADGSCHPLAAKYTHADIAVVPSGDCTPSGGGTHMGAVTPTGVVTMCCAN